MLLFINEQINKVPLLRRLYRSILNRLLVTFKKEGFYINFKNLKLSINIKDPIDKVIFYLNKYEEKQYNFLCSFIKKNKQDYFIDIGANFGIYSLRISKLFPKLKILAFEPVPSTFKKLEENIKLNSLKNIMSFNIGISNSTGIKKMIAQKRKNYIQSGGFSFNIPKRKKRKDEILKKYQSILGDKIIKLKNKRLILKIDVERYEEKVLLGIKKLLKKNKILIQIEIFRGNFDKINKLLLKNKFKLINNFNNTNDYHYINY